MTDAGGIDPDRLPNPDVQDPDVSRPVDLGTATHDDFTAPDTAPVADADVGTLRTMLGADEAPTRRRGVLALAERGAAGENRAAIEALLRTDSDAEVRQFAVEALAAAGVEPETLRVGLEDANPWVRAETIVSLKQTAPRRAIGDFEAGLEDPHPAVRRNALISLYHAAGEDAIDALEAGLSDESERVREWAVRLLGDLDPPDLASRFQAHLESEPSHVVREAIGRALDGTTSVELSGGSGRRRADDHVLNRRPD